MPAGLTKHRKTVLELVSASAVPLSAAQVQKMTRGINLATIYRALEFLEKSGSLTSFTFVCEAEGKGRYYAKSEPHAHFIHCERCHVFIALPFCVVAESIARIEKANDFYVRSHTLFFVGLCGKCRTAKSA